MKKKYIVTCDEGYFGIGLSVSEAFDDLTNHTTVDLDSCVFFECEDIEVELVRKLTVYPKVK